MNRSFLLFIASSIIFATHCSAHFSLLIAQPEIRKLLGLSSSELYYVRNGVINTYALNFEVPVPANMSQLEFQWQTFNRHPLPYVWTVEYNNRQAMKRPTFDISTQGILPTRLSTFHVRLHCTGEVSAQVKILLHLNVSAISHRHNETYLVLRRNKLCLRRADAPTTAPSVSPAIADEEIVRQSPAATLNNKSNMDQISTPSTALTTSPTKSNNNHNTTIVKIDDDRGSERLRESEQDDTLLYILLGCSMGLLLVLILFFFNSTLINTYIVLKKTKMPRNSPRSDYSTTTTAYNTPPTNRNVFVRLTSSGSYATVTGTRHHNSNATYSPRFISPYAATSVVRNGTRTLPRPESSLYSEEHIYSKPESVSKVSYYASSQLISMNKTALHDPRQHDVSERCARLTVPRSCLSGQKSIAEGAYGQIYKAFLRHPSATGDKTESVLVKTVSEEASLQQTSSMLAEGLMMYDLKHINILSVIASNCDHHLPPLLIYPLPSKGNLKLYLQSCRPHNSVSTRDVMDMAVQVAVAGVFMHTNGFCHKDLATRNCVVDDDFRIKVADSALSRDLFPDDYHCLGDNENRPIKWLAIESLTERHFSGASDVWSFGVLLWELMSYAAQPYEGIDASDVDLYLTDGYRLSQPINCPDHLYGMMNCCWLENPEERPTFVQLLSCLHDFQIAPSNIV